MVDGDLQASKVLDFDHCNRWCHLGWVLSSGHVVLVDLQTVTTKTLRGLEGKSPEDAVLCLSCERWEIAATVENEVFAWFPEVGGKFRVEVSTSTNLHERTKNKWAVKEGIKRARSEWESSRDFVPPSLQRERRRLASLRVGTSGEVFWVFSTSKVVGGLIFPIDGPRWPAPFSWTRLGGVVWAERHTTVVRGPDLHLKEVEVQKWKTGLLGGEGNKYATDLLPGEIGGMEDWRGSLWSVGEGKLIRRLPV